MAVKTNEEPKTGSREGSTLKQWTTTFTLNISMLTYGMQSGWMSPAISKLQATDSPSGYSMTDMEVSFIASALSVAAVMSTVFYSYFVDRFGRKMAIIAVLLPQLIGWSLKIFSANIISLIISQVFVGMSAGGVFGVAPIYVKELCEDHLRALVSSFGMLLLSLGVLISYTMGAYLNYYTVLYISTCVPLLNFVLILTVVPESPAYLVKIQKIEKTKEILASLFGLSKDHKKVQAVVEELVAQNDQTIKMPKVSFRTIFADKVNRRAFLIGLLMMTVLNMTGAYAVLSYASLILARSRVSFYPDLQAISFPAVMLIGSWISTITIPKFGRKTLLTTYFFINAIPLATLGVHVQLIDRGYSPPQWIPVASIVLNLFSYGAGLLPIPYLVMSEILRFQIRAKSFGVYVTYGWSLCFLQAFSFTPISQVFGMYSVFYVYAILNALSGMTLLLLMPETKGKTFEEIENKFRGK